MSTVYLTEAAIVVVSKEFGLRCLGWLLDFDFLDSRASVEGAKVRSWGLFIAFDQNGYVSAREVCRISNPDPQKACEKRALSKNQ